MRARSCSPKKLAAVQSDLFRASQNPQTEKKKTKLPFIERAQDARMSSRLTTFQFILAEFKRVYSSLLLVRTYKSYIPIKIWNYCTDSKETF